MRLAERLADRPTASLPGACAGRAETQGAYRLLRQETFDWLDLLEPHRQCTTQRMAQHPVVLCIQDTTELDFNRLAAPVPKPRIDLTRFHGVTIRQWDGKGLLVRIENDD